MIKKKIVFLTGTRADFGKIKSLIQITQNSDLFDVYIFVTGMHLNSKYGATIDEIYKSGFKNIYPYINHSDIDHMDRNLAKTIDGFSLYISEIEPDLIVVHGDRVEAMAGAIVGSLNNILVAHIEGGEISGTIDELIRHSISKLSHIHLVTNQKAKKRLLQLGELRDSIFVIGSPDLDLMNSDKLPKLSMVKDYYDIDFDKYALAIFHPVTTEYKDIKRYVKSFVDALLESRLNYIVVYPNNDLGSIEILDEYKRLQNSKNIKLFPSLRFEFFLILLKNAQFMVGNSSAGIREAPHYNVATIDIGTRQNKRVNIDSVIHVSYDKDEILDAILNIEKLTIDSFIKDNNFGDGKSDEMFFKLLQDERFWSIKHQKQFQELDKDE